MKIRADFNDEFEKGKIWLGSLLEMEDNVAVGKAVVLHEEDFEVDAVLDYDKEKKGWIGLYENGWRRYFMWDDIRSDRWEWGTKDDIYIIKNDKFNIPFYGTLRDNVPCCPCPKCSYWSADGYNYPQVDPPDPEGFCNRIPRKQISTMDEFTGLLSSIKSIIGSDLPIPPGTSIRAPRNIFNIDRLPKDNFLYNDHFIRPYALELLKSEGFNLQVVEIDALLVSAEIFNRLEKEGMNQIVERIGQGDFEGPSLYSYMRESVKSDIKGRGSSWDIIELYEPIALPLALISEECYPGGFPDPCPICGRRAVEVPKEIVLDADFIPRNVHFFKARNLPYDTFITSSLVEAIQRLKLDEGITFEKVKLRYHKD